MLFHDNYISSSYVGSTLCLLCQFSGCSSLAVLEGIAISSDPNYKVLGNTYPWIARKVLTDSSPKLKSSLQALLYKVYQLQEG